MGQRLTHQEFKTNDAQGKVVTADYYLKNKTDEISGREDGATLNLEVTGLYE